MKKDDKVSYTALFPQGFILLYTYDGSQATEPRRHRENHGIFVIKSHSPERIITDNIPDYATF
jgi:hypothetical protein